MNARRRTSPQIGIWWDDGKKIVAFHHSIAESECVAGWCDSDYSHVDFWPEAAPEYGLNEFVEYFGIPRGRVLWSPAKQLSRIYHGNETTVERLALIAIKFCLESWDAETDMHYMTGGFADHLFDE